MLLTACCLQPATIIRLYHASLVCQDLFSQLNLLRLQSNITTLLNNQSVHGIKNMVTLPTPESSLQPFMLNLKCSLSMNLFFVSAVFAEHLKLFFHHCTNRVLEFSWQLIVETATKTLVPFTNSYNPKNYCADLLDGVVISHGF